MTFGNAYYYITKNGVMKGFGTSSSDDASDSGDDSAELIAGDFINIYNGMGLLKDGRVVDLVNGGTSAEAVDGIELLDDEYSLECFRLNSTLVNTYHRFSTVGSGEDVIDREAQILKSENGSINIVHSSIQNVKDSVVMYNKDGEEYLTVLGTDGIMIDLYQGDDLNVPKDFKRGGIVYMTNNFETSAPFVLVEYQNGGIVGFNYMTGKYLFDNSVKNEMSLLDYVKVYLNEEKSKLSSAPVGYAATQQVAEFAGTPDRLQTFAFGVNNGEVIEGNNTDSELKASSESDETNVTGDDTLKAGEDTKMKNPEANSGIFNDKKADETTVKTPVAEDDYDITDGSRSLDGESDANGVGLGKGTTAENTSGIEGAGAGESDNLVVDGGDGNRGGGSSMADGSSEGEGDGVSELPDPKFDDDGTGDNLSDDASTGKGKGKVDASGENNPSKPSVVPNGSAVDGGDTPSVVNMDKNNVASTATDMATNLPEFEDGTTDGVAVGEVTPTVKDKLDGDEKTDITLTEDQVLTEKRLMTVYNQSTGTYEIIDMDQFLTSKDYKSENDRLAIRDFGVYGGYATAEKPKDEENRNGILLYILVSIALVGGVSGAFYYKKKHKVKI